MSILNNYTDEEIEQIVNQSNSYREVAQKIGYTHTCSGDVLKKIKNKIESLGISVSHFGRRKLTTRTVENVFIENSTASQRTLRDFFLRGNYQEYKCSICGQEPFWNGKPLTLILDHINGINNDDRLENLHWVCPNCNQQLETTGFKKIRTKDKPKKHYYCIDCGKEIWRDANRCIKCASKARKTQRKVNDRPSRDELKQMIRIRSMTDIGNSYGVTDNSIRKWCKAYNLPFRVSEIKQYTDEEWSQI